MGHDTSKQSLPRHVEEAVKQISAIHKAHHAEARPSERVTDRAVAVIGTPTFLAVLITVFAGWTALNGIHVLAIDLPPFPVLETACSLASVLIAVLILAAQRRDDRLATRREQMTLQVGLLTEQKVSKLIELLEELRRDLPGVHNRLDLDAIEMTATADHQTALKTVEEASVQPDNTASE